MKIISASYSGLDMIERELRGNEPGIVVLPEGCWDNLDGLKFDDFLSATLDYSVSIIGTRKGTKKFDVVYVIRKGRVKPVGIYIHDDVKGYNRSVRDLRSRFNRPHDISPTEDPILALIKQCSEVYHSPLEDEGKIDLVCVPSSIDHTLNENGRDLLLGVNRKNISESSLLVQAVLDNTNGTDIFQLPDFRRLGRKVNGYSVHQYSKP